MDGVTPAHLGQPCSAVPLPVGLQVATGVRSLVNQTQQLDSLCRRRRRREFVPAGQTGRRLIRYYCYLMVLCGILERSTSDRAASSQCSERLNKSNPNSSVIKKKIKSQMRMSCFQDHAIPLFRRDEPKTMLVFPAVKLSHCCSWLLQINDAVGRLRHKSMTLLVDVFFKVIEE